MLRTGLDHKRPSLLSLALIAGFSFAAVVVSGWLVMILTFANDANPNAADPAATPASAAADVAALAGISASQTEGALPSNAPPGAGTPSAGMPPPPANGAPLAVGAPTAALGGPAAEMTYRGPGDLLNFQSDDENAAPEAVPLPPPRPRRTASVPMPRPRPPIDAEQATPAPQRSLLDIFVGR